MKSDWVNKCLYGLENILGVSYEGFEEEVLSSLQLNPPARVIKEHQDP